jgi:hypothetical protein
VYPLLPKLKYFSTTIQVCHGDNPRKIEIGQKKKHRPFVDMRGYYSKRDWKKAFTTQNDEVFTLERRISRENRSVGLESVHN